MNYLSVCSGIEAATVAWHELGFNPVGFSEIEPFPAAALQHHYPNVPNFGDMTKFKEWNLDPNRVDLLVGGTPCQSFSVAGLRKGLDDPRGNLALTYCSMLDHFRPTWFIWENVPGVLSSSGGRDFGSFLGAVAELGYGFAYRVLDAQYFGVAQRRRRVFVVGHLGNWQRAAAVLFERESLCRDTAPRRETREETAKCLTTGVGQRYDPETESLIPAFGIPGNWIGRAPENGGNAVEPMHDVAPCLTKTDRHGVAQPMVLMDQGGSVMNVMQDGTVGTLRRETHGHEPIIAQPVYPIDTMNHIGRPDTHSLGDFVDGALTKGHSHAVAYGVGESPDTAHCLRSGASKADKHESTTYVAQPFQQTSDCLTAAYGTKWNGNASADNGSLFASHGMAVRRLTPVECERLQGFPDNYTNIPWRKKDESPDGPRYKALGNSMAVPVMRWIGERINQVKEIA